MLSFLVSFALLSSALGFMGPSRLPSTAKASSALRMSLNRPKLYVYDHCPFCVRVRMAFGLKGIKHELVFLANDDKELPISLVGKKVSPIFE
jgi:hypothetical protein